MFYDLNQSTDQTLFVKCNTKYPQHKVTTNFVINKALNKTGTEEMPQMSQMLLR